MLLLETQLPGILVLEMEKKEDERGFFSRVWCREEFRRRGMNPGLEQCSLSYNRKKGTLRGMHFQREPYGEDKLLFCTAGAIYDVVIDLRPRSRTYKKWTAVELSQESRKMLYVPKGFAHGFQTLADDTEVFYMISTPFYPDHAGGVRWDDPAFGIVWPEEPARILSAKDKSWPDFTG